MNKIVEFKGTKEGIVLQLRPFHCFEEVAECIHNKFAKSAQFFTGATIIGTEGEIGSERNRFELFKLLTDDYKLNVVSLDRMVKVEKTEVEEPEPVEETKPEKIDYNEYDTKIVRKNLRSGMNVSYDGNIVVIGDVNPGAEISAGGNVIVMGKLRGLVHAGKNGNKETYIIASKMAPTQIRIGNVIARAPEEDHIDELKPEIACLKSGQMSIEEL